MLLHDFAQQFVYVYNTLLFRSRPHDKVQRGRALGKGRPRAGQCRVNRLKALTTVRYRNPWKWRSLSEGLYFPPFVGLLQ
jgi:hypothetical protein